MEFVFIGKEELEILVEKLINLKTNRRNALIEIDYNLETNTTQSYLDGENFSFKDNVVPMLEQHFNRAIKKVEFTDFNLEESFVFLH